MNDIEELLNSLSEDTKKLISDNKWSEAIDKATQNEINIIAELYLRHLCEKGNQWESIGWNKIEPIKKVLIKWIKELGLRESQNPYMQFIPAFYSIDSNKSRTLTENNCIELNNLYADRVLDFSDIAGTGVNGLEHIIFNQNLYNFNMNDLDFIVRAYETLSSKNFIKKLNLDAVKQQLIRYKHESNANYIDSNADNVKAIRNAILYKEPTKSQTSEIFDKTVIEDILSSGEHVATSDEKDELSQEDGVKALKALTSKEARSKLGLSDEVLRKLIDAGAQID